METLDCIIVRNIGTLSWGIISQGKELTPQLKTIGDLERTRVLVIMNRHYMALMKRIKRVAMQGNRGIIFMIKIMVMKMMIVMLLNCRIPIIILEIFTILWEKKGQEHKQEMLMPRLHIYV